MKTLLFAPQDRRLAPVLQVVKNDGKRTGCILTGPARRERGESPHHGNEVFHPTGKGIQIKEEDFVALDAPCLARVSSGLTITIVVTIMIVMSITVDYTIRHIPRDLWRKVKLRAQLEDRPSLRALILRLLEDYANADAEALEDAALLRLSERSLKEPGDDIPIDQVAKKYGLTAAGKTRRRA